MIKEVFNQLPMFPCFRIKGTEKEFFTLQEAAVYLKNVTPNPSHELIRRPGRDHEKHPIYKKRSIDLQTKGTFTRPTLIKEIESKPPTPHDDIFSYYHKTFGKEQINIDAFVKLSIDALMKSIEEQWDSSVLHIMPFSSGYDSRLIALLLEKLYKKNGPDWFGDMIFFVFEPEIEYAINVFNYLEFPNEWLIPIRPNNKIGVDYYSEVLDFNKVGEWYCEAERFWAGPVLARIVLLDQLGIRDAVGISGLFGDETSKANKRDWPDVGYFVSCYHFDNPTPFLGSNIRFMFPFTSREYLDVILKYRIQLKVDPNKLSLITYLNETFSDIKKTPNYRFIHAPILREKGHDIFQLLSQNTVDKMKKSFLNSWYCKTYKKEHIVPFSKVMPYYSDAGTEYIKAAIYENLIKKGCNFND